MEPIINEKKYSYAEQNGWAELNKPLKPKPQDKYWSFLYERNGLLYKKYDLVNAEEVIADYRVLKVNGVIYNCNKNTKGQHLLVKTFLEKGEVYLSLNWVIENTIDFYRIEEFLKIKSGDKRYILTDKYYALFNKFKVIDLETSQVIFEFKYWYNYLIDFIYNDWDLPLQAICWDYSTDWVIQDHKKNWVE